MAIIIKTSASPEGGLLRVTESGYGDPHLSAGRLAYVWTSEAAGGDGLRSRGIVEAVSPEEDGNLSLQVRLVGESPQRPLTKVMLAPHRDGSGDDPTTLLARKLYRHAHNKIAELSATEAAFLTATLKHRAAR